MLPLSFQRKNTSERLVIVLAVAKSIASISKAKYPSIYRLINAGNAKKVAVINSIITQMETLGFDVDASLSAVEQNI